jgi:hypothetical protein
VHTFVNDLERKVGTYLYERRMYEVMRYWETALDVTGRPLVEQDYAHIWRSADKIVYSKTLQAVSSARTWIERNLDPEAVRRMKGQTQRHISVGGPGWSTSTTCSWRPTWWGRQTGAPCKRPPGARTAGRTPFRGRRTLPSLPHRDVWRPRRLTYWLKGRKAYYGISLA